MSHYDDHYAAHNAKRDKKMLADGYVKIPANIRKYFSNWEWISQADLEILRDFITGQDL